MRVKGPVLVIILLSIVASFTLFAGISWQKKYAVLPEFGKVDSFQLIDSDNTTFRSEDLRGKIWIANFVFSQCKGICPIMSKKMNELEEAFKKHDDLTLVSLTIDPANDTPELLQKFSEKYSQKKGKNRYYLTGNRDRIKSLLNKDFKLGFPENPQIHTDRFVLIDRDMNIRGFYASSDPLLVFKVKRDASKLLVGL